MESAAQPAPPSPSSSEHDDNEPNLSSAHSPSTAVETPSNSPSTYPIRRRRNPAVLIRWIEEHPFNPYPTKVEKQSLAFYAGMTQRQLNDWFANARRNIKKVGYENWKKKHSGFSAILSGIPLAGSSCNFPVLSTSSSNNTHHTFTIAPLSRPSLSTSVPNTLMSYTPNGPLANMATVKPSPLQNPSFVKVESGAVNGPPSAVSPVHYYGGYSLAAENNLSPCSTVSPVSLPSLPFSHESFYQLAGQGHAVGTATNNSASYPILAVDASLRSFSTPTTATLPYVACDQCTASTPAPAPHHLNMNSTVLYNWAPPAVGSTTMLNHGFGLPSAPTPPPPPPPPPSGVTTSNPSATDNRPDQACERQTGEHGAQEHDSSPQESGYYSGTTSPTTTHHR